MPIYEYECKKCGKKFEKKYGIRENPVQMFCTECKELLRYGEFEKVVSRSTFILKFDTNY